MSQVILTSPFSAVDKGWWLYHLLVHSIPYFLHISQCTRRATLSWRFLYSLWASFLHPLTMCLTVSVVSPHNLHSGVSEVLSMLYLIEFVLKAQLFLSRQNQAFCLRFKNPFLSHLQDSSPATFDICWINSPCRVFSFQFLTFSSFLLLS